MSEFDRDQPVTDQQILEMEPEDAIRFLVESQGLTEAEAREAYEAIIDRAEEGEEDDDALA